MNAPVDFKAIEGMFRRHYKQIEVRFDPEHAIAWTYMKPTGAPCFNLGMLEELRVMFESRGFLEGSHSQPGHFVIEKAFVER